MHASIDFDRAIFPWQELVNIYKYFGIQAPE